MKRLFAILMSVAVSSMFGSLARAADDAAKCAETIKLFQDAGESAGYFKNSYGYAVFPTIGKAGLGIGGAHGSGCVYKQGKQVGTAKMNQVSFGWQAGAQGYSLLVFFEDERAFNGVHVGQLRVRGQSQCRRHHGGSVRRRRYERYVLRRKRRKE